MKRKITVENQAYNVDYPDKCPICHHYSEIGVVQTLNEPNDAGFQVVFLCAFSGCKSVNLPLLVPLKSGGFQRLM